MKRLAAGFAWLLVAALGVVAGVGWHYSNQILGPDQPPANHGQPVLAVTESTITLAPTPKAVRPGRWAIEWDDGYGELGAILDSSAGGITRRFRLGSGKLPGTEARLAGFAREANPRSWLDLDYRDVAIPARIGTLPGWLVPGPDSTWVIFVHGRGATRAEMLRMLPAFHGLGLPCLVVTYRNQSGAPRAGDGRYRMGVTEWLDVEDALRFARTQGARDVVLVGCSMGGLIVTECLRRSSLLAHVRGAMLDAPALDWPAAVARTAQNRRVPRPITTLGLWVASLRSGIDWGDLIEARHAGQFGTPMLILHGDADDVVPIDASLGFAASRRDLVTLVTVPGAGHVEGFNYDSERCIRVVRTWLAELGPREGAIPSSGPGGVVSSAGKGVVP